MIGWEIPVTILATGRLFCLYTPLLAEWFVKLRRWSTPQPGHEKTAVTRLRLYPGTMNAHAGVDLIVM
jgi:hypothetical protein